MAGIVTANTPKGVTPNGEFQNIPGSFFIKNMSITNQFGREIDLKPLVTSFTLTEELFSPVVLLNINIRDNINFFEDFAINGQEIINITLEQDRGKNINLNFIVKEYPNYEKRPLSSVQEYSLIAVSDFAYLSLLKRISRSVKGNVVDNIVNILKNDLNIENIAISEPCISSFDGVLVIQTPLKAIEWLRQKAYDTVESPFFIFSQICTRNINITSLAKLLKGNLYKIYEYKSYQSTVPGTPKAYEEGTRKIINIKSNIRLDKLKQANDGAFASKTIVIDIAKKSFFSKIFSRDDDNNSSLKNSPYNPTLNFLTNGVTFSGEQLTNLPDASRTIISTNTNSNSSSNPNSSTLAAESLGRVKSYLANMELFNHQIEVYGDLELNPGRKIEINIPKSSDISEYNKLNGSSGDDTDKALSGLYLVAVSIHTFKDGKYTTTCKIMKEQ